MNVVLNDVVHCDEVQLTLPRTPLSSGQTHPSMDENIREIFRTLHIELIEYDAIIRIPAGDKVVIRVRGRGCQDRHAR